MYCLFFFFAVINEKKTKTILNIRQVQHIGLAFGSGTVVEGKPSSPFPIIAKAMSFVCKLHIICTCVTGGAYVSMCLWER